MRYEECGFMGQYRLILGTPRVERAGAGISDNAAAAMLAGAAGCWQGTDGCQVNVSLIALWPGGTAHTGQRRPPVTPSPAYENGHVLDFEGFPGRWEILESAEETGGERFRTRMQLDERSELPPHVHPKAEESYEVVTGELEVLVGEEWSTVSAGEKRSSRRGRRTRSGTRAPRRSSTCTARRSGSRSSSDGSKR